MRQFNLHTDTWFKYITHCNFISEMVMFPWLWWWLFCACAYVCVYDEGEGLEERLAPLPVAWKSSSGSLS